MLRWRHCNRLRFSSYKRRLLRVEPLEHDLLACAKRPAEAVSKSAPQHASSSSGSRAIYRDDIVLHGIITGTGFQGDMDGCRWPGERSGPKQGKIGPKQHVSARFEARTISTHFNTLQPVSAHFGPFRSPTS